MIEETQGVVVEERITLSKFEGEPLPENEIERVHILDGKVVAVEEIKDGVVVSTKEV